MDNTNDIRTPAGNSKSLVDQKANELMKWGIMAAGFGFAWPVAFLGIAFGLKAKKLEKEFLALEGRTYNCAKVGAICGKVGFIAGIVMTCFLVIYVAMIFLYLFLYGAFMVNASRR